MPPPSESYKVTTMSHAGKKSWQFCRRLRAGLLLCFLAAPLCFFQAGGESRGAAPGEPSLRETLSREEERARSRRESLRRLTEEEKRLDVSLAETEQAVLGLEKSLEECRGRLRALASAGESVHKEYEALLAERRQAESSLQELLSVLWGLYTRRISVGGRDLAQWPVLEREYYWTADLLQAVERRQEILKEKERGLAETIGKRDAIGREIAGQMALIDQRKEALLDERLKYEQGLALLRRQLKSEETELQELLALIANLNSGLRSAGEAAASLGRFKGTLPWPVAGKVVKKFNPALSVPMRGLGIATGVEADVRAVHAGKVMYQGAMRGKGYVVLLEHSDSYYSLYAYLSSCAVSLGQEIPRGQTLGRSGFNPEINGYGLHFELRHQQLALNPEQWLEKS
ncbi:MAG: peptidoglycan DD-metalloendopeptidase family protein [Desulfovibrionaceae bacterium]|nr:peptidoglycan DD-metalloendopeptidase family protein [Desulfovibrionaceae bacterium]